MKIYLRQGIENFTFGMTQPEIESNFGKPNRELIDQDDENELIWEYTEEKTRLTFYKNESGKLGYIRSSNSNLILNDSKIIDQKINDVMRQVDSDPNSWEIEDHDSFCVYFHESSWLTLNVEYERVTDIELGVPFNDNDEYDWPEENSPLK